MRTSDNGIQLSASDLTSHLACKHLTQLDRAVAEGLAEAPSLYFDPVLELLQRRGLEHETAYVEHLKRERRVAGIVEVREFSGGDAAERTLAAMRAGSDVVVQGVLRDGRWHGRSDILLRVETPSDLGEWSYEVIDTKLAQDTKGSTVLQLCLYSDMLSRVQGRAPECMHVVKPGDGFPTDSYRYAEYAPYFRLARRRLESTLAGAPDQGTYPLPVAHCDVCRWWRQCDERRRKDDHLTLVAGMTVAHVKEFNRQGVATLAGLANRNPALTERPKQGSPETFERLGKQARVQLQGRERKAPVYELIEPEAGRGLARLPEPDRGDIFFDIEGDALLEEVGREYLLGYTYEDDDGLKQYASLWGSTAAEEKAAFESFIDFVMHRWREHAGLHVYHFAPYEVGAVKRLMSRHATREVEVDKLLRAGRFIDLHAVARQGVRASVESYTLKDLEPFHGFTRDQDLRAATMARRRVSLFLQANDADGIPDEDRRAVEAYNREDCESTHSLQSWLEDRRDELVTGGHEIDRPELLDGDASGAAQERQGELAEVFNALTKDLPEARDTWSQSEQGQWLLAHLLEYFRREDRCVWWDFFRLHEADAETLHEERKALTELVHVGTIGGTTKCPVDRYRFPLQESSLSEGDELHEVGGEKVGTVDAVDIATGTVDIRKTSKASGVHPESVLVLQRVSPFPLDASVLSLARSVVDHGIDGDGPFRASRDLALGRSPRLRTVADGPLRRAGEELVEAAVRLAHDLEGGVLPIQGPPGTGKTYTAAEVIVSLAATGKRVGVTAVSHKVIRNLLAKVVESAARQGVAVQVAHKPGKGETPANDGVDELKDNAEALAAVDAGAVVGGTAWLWARDDSVERLDYLIIDEAGQVSLVQALAASRAARNLILVGDPQQLEQPQQGSHPEGADVAALQHVIGDRETVADDRGLFLDETRRLHPGICSFTSEMYYEGRLRAREGLERQSLSGAGPFDQGQLFFVPVPHAANQNRSLEEAEVIHHVMISMLTSGSVWKDEQGDTHALTPDDVLVVTPYNAQVGLLRELLPGHRIGTVDKFQGQEAPVVIYSMCSSSATDAPRGMRFLYSPNRFNVATSRARCTCILVACPDVLEPECNSPEQMQWASGLCRFRELATAVELPACTGRRMQ